MTAISPEDYKKAILIQDACNLSGVVHTFSGVLKKIWEEAHGLGHGTDWVNRHPISILYSSKINSLTGSEHFENFSDAYDKCDRMSKSESDQ